VTSTNLPVVSTAPACISAGRIQFDFPAYSPKAAAYRFAAAACSTHLDQLPVFLISSNEHQMREGVMSFSALNPLRRCSLSPSIMFVVSWTSVECYALRPPPMIIDHFCRASFVFTGVTSLFSSTALFLRSTASSLRHEVSFRRHSVEIVGNC